MKTSFHALLLGLVCGVGSCGGGGPGSPASEDPKEIALLRIDPADSESDVARNGVIRLTFNTTVLPESIHDQSIRVRDVVNWSRPTGSFLISGNVVTFDPTLGKDGKPNAGGFEAGLTLVVWVPVADGVTPANNYVRNVEGNPLEITSSDNFILFRTGAGWNDPVDGPPGVLGLEFTPRPNAIGLVRPETAVTVVFSEPMDPESVRLGANIFLTNNTETSGFFQLPIPSQTVFDGSLTRFTFVPVFGYGKGPFSILLNFIDPRNPETFDPARLPRDLGGNQVQNFTFLQTFDTEFDPDAPTTGIILEEFRSKTKMDVAETTAVWGDDAEFPFSLINQPIVSRIARVNRPLLLGLGVVTDLTTNCTWTGILAAPDITHPAGSPPTAEGRRMLSLYRAAELGGAGTIVRAAWRPAGGSRLSQYDRVVVRMGHKTQGTNLSVGTFDQEFDVDGSVVVADSQYTVPEGTTGFVDWPQFDRPFEYDGVNDLLFEVRSTEGTASQGLRIFVPAIGAEPPSPPGTPPPPPGCPTLGCNGLFQGMTGCTLSNAIGARMKAGVFDSDVLKPSGLLNNIPNPGPVVYIMEFEFAQLDTVAQSKWYDTGVNEPDYVIGLVTPVVQPAGASFEIEYAGSMDGLVEDIGFTADLQELDGMRYVRWRATLRANLITGSRARADTIQILFKLE